MKEVPAAKEEAKKDDAKKEQLKNAAQKLGAELLYHPIDLGRLVKEYLDKKDDAKNATRFEIKVPTNPELAANLKGKLLLVHGDMDNNVHPANTIRLVDALIKANKRFDLLILPGKAHGFAEYQPYFTQRMWEYFAENLLDDRSSGADPFAR